MSRMTSQYPERVYSSGEEERRRPLMDRMGRGGASGAGWVLVGLAAVGLGALAWSYLGPDLRRYLKIRSM